MERSSGSFREEVVEVFANDEHGVLLLQHDFDRDAKARSYGTANIVELADGMITSWREYPGSVAEFEEAWDARSGAQ